MRTGDEDEKDPAKAAERKKAVIPLAIADGQQAVRLVRAHPSEWGIARDRIVLLGFSARRHFSRLLAVQRGAQSPPEFCAALASPPPPHTPPPPDTPPTFLPPPS